jgi:phage terminase large subunit-like protein
MVDRKFDNVVDSEDEAGSDIAGYLQGELEQLRRNPMKYGHPPHQVQEAMLSETSRRRIIVAANRSGKTEGAMRDVLWSARGEHPYKKVKLVNNIWCGCPDYPSYIRFTKPAFDQWCPPEWIKGSFHESDKWVDIKRVDGGVCRISFLSYDMPRTKWQGAGVDGIWLDEESPEDIFNECMARIVTTRGWILLTFTPVSGVGWWYDRLWKPSVDRDDGKWTCYQAPLAVFDEANEAEFNVGAALVPHLTRPQIIDFASTYPDEDERLIRIFGQVRGRTGLVYRMYEPNIHKIPAFRIPAHYELWGAIDPGFHGFAAIIGAISPGNRMYIAKEYFSQQETTRTRFAALAEKVRELRTREEWGQHHPCVVFFVDTEDPQVVLELNTQAVAQAEEDSMAKNADGTPKLVVSLAFVSIDQGLKARKAGFLRIQQTLFPVPDRQRPVVVQRDKPVKGEPMMYFFDDLYSEWQEEDAYHRESRLLWEIERYSWKKPPKGSTVKPDDADENTAGGAHKMACLRYLVMSRLGPPEEPKEEKRSSMNPVDRMVQEAFEELEERQLDEAGLL